MAFEKTAEFQDYEIKQKRLCIPFAIVHNATPANKTNSNDLSACMILSLEGQTATATAADSGTTFTTPTDSTGVFGILLKGLGTVHKVLNVATFGLSTGSIALTLVGASSTGVTASGNIAVSADWDGSLASTDLSGTFIVDFNVYKS